MIPFTIEESFTNQVELSDIKTEQDFLSFHHHRTTRTMSCPARLKAEEESNLFKRAASNFAVTGLKLSELRRDFLPTIKTLALLFLYLLMSSPFYISATVHRHCSPVHFSVLKIVYLLHHETAFLFLGRMQTIWGVCENILPSVYFGSDYLPLHLAAFRPTICTARLPDMSNGGGKLGTTSTS